MRYRYNPQDYVDYIRDCLQGFQKSYEENNIMRMKTFWDRLYFDTKQAVKEHRLSLQERDDMLDYYEELMADA